MRIAKPGESKDNQPPINMAPATSRKQQALFGAAIAAKRGKPSFPAAQKLASSMSEKKLKDFTKLKKKK